MAGFQVTTEGEKQAKLSRSILETYIDQLDEVLNVGMQVLEDALCNWQKSPNDFVPFRG